MAGKQFLAQSVLQVAVTPKQGRRVGVGIEHPPRQGEPIGVQAAGGDTHQAIAGFYSIAFQQVIPFRHADQKAGQVKVGGGVEAGQLRRFPADQGATHFPAAPDNPAQQGFHTLLVQIAESHIVQEKEGFGAFGQDVVDIERNQILPNGLVVAELGGDFQFGADPVGAGDQYRPPVAGQLEQAGKPAAGADNFRPVRHRRKGFDAGFQLLHSVQVDAGSLVSVAGQDGCSGKFPLSLAGNAGRGESAAVSGRRWGYCSTKRRRRWQW